MWSGPAGAPASPRKQQPRGERGHSGSERQRSTAAEDDGKLQQRTCSITPWRGSVAAGVSLAGQSASSVTSGARRWLR